MLSIQSVAHAFSGKPVLKDIDLEVAEGEIVCLLGESGSGKTTLLRIVAGLEKGYQGTVKADGYPIDNIPVHKRGFGLMFQDFALFPHMTVGQNVAFGLKMHGVASEERREKVTEGLNRVGLSGFEDRDVTALSGGEKQRVALARSIAPEPRLLMLDEPLGSLDAALKEKLVVELRDIIKSIGLTALYVTHDQQEAYAIADRIAVVHKGQIAQVDTPEALYQYPKSEFVARFLGLTNIIPAQKLNTSGGFPVPEGATAVLLHPAGIRIVQETGENTLLAEVKSSVFRGSHYKVKAQVEDYMLEFDVPLSKTAVEPHATVQIAIEPTAVIGLA